MVGNEAEWVEDRFLPRILSRISIDEIHRLAFDADITRVIRGSSWDSRPWPMITCCRESEPPTIRKLVGGLALCNFYISR